MTLLFIITQLGTLSEKPQIIGAVAGIGSIFILTVIFATMALGDVTPHAARKQTVFDRLVPFLDFLGGFVLRFECELPTPSTSLASQAFTSSGLSMSREGLVASTNVSYGCASVGDADL